LIHEQNSAAGLANRFLARRAHAVALTYDAAREKLRTSGHLALTGNPVRAALLEATRESGRMLFGLPLDARVLLVFGGSLGAQHINRSIVALAPRLMQQPDLHVVQISGRRDFDEMQASLAAADIPVLIHPEEVYDADRANDPEPGACTPSAPRWHLLPYCARMGEALAACDLVLARAGATSLAEITALGVPALLIPFPYATDDHQTTNARTLVEAGAAVMLADSELDTPAFANTLLSLLADAPRRQQMATAAANLGNQDATAAIIELLYQITK